MIEIMKSLYWMNRRPHVLLKGPLYASHSESISGWCCCANSMPKIKQWYINKLRPELQHDYSLVKPWLGKFHYMFFFFFFFMESESMRKKRSEQNMVCQSSVFKAISITMSIAWNKAMLIRELGLVAINWSHWNNTDHIFGIKTCTTEQS